MKTENAEKHTREKYPYRVMLDGRIYSVTYNWRGYGIRLLTQHLNAHGYPRVRFSVNGKRKSYLVHKLVASVYLPKRPSLKHEIRHLDGNKTNNHYTNLAWGTRKENAADRDRHGRTSRGIKHSLAIKASNQAEGTRAFRKAQKEGRI